MTAPNAPLTLVLAQTLTLDDTRPRAEAVLVGGGRVLAVGRREELLAQAPRAEVLDHRDLLLTPGLADSHIHLVKYGLSLSRLDLAGCRSVAELQGRLADYLAPLPPGSWVLGAGFLFSELGLADYPSAGALDAVSPQHPVVLYSRDLHSAWANSLALRLAGVNEQTPGPAGGRIVQPLGVLLEGATELLARAIPAPDEAELLEAARRGSQDLFSRGYVSAHCMAAEPAEHPAALQALAQRGELPLRVWACLPHARLALARDLGLHGSAGGLFQWGGVKFFADGALGSRTALLWEPGFADGSGTGIRLDPPELVRELGREALSLGLSPVTHAIGDRANSEMLDVYEELAPLARQRGLRLRIEHAQHLRPADLPRFGELGLVASAQPIHLLADAAMIRDLLPHLEATSYAFRSLKQAGATLAFGSDAPVALPDVQASFHAATTRLDDGGVALAPEEALTPEETLWAFTRGAALAANWDDEGIIRPGARAAFTLWDRLGGQAQALVL